MKCYKKDGGCGPYEMYSCNECPARHPEYAEKYSKVKMESEKKMNLNKIRETLGYEDFDFNKSFKVKIFNENAKEDCDIFSTKEVRIVDLETNLYVEEFDGRCWRDSKITFEMIAFANNISIIKKPEYPPHGEAYYYVDVNGKVRVTKFLTKSFKDMMCFKTGNYYNTEEQAEKEASAWEDFFRDAKPLQSPLIKTF